MVAGGKHGTFVQINTHPADLPIQYVTWVRLDNDISRTLVNSTILDLDYDSFANISTAVSKALSNKTQRLLLHSPVRYADQQKSPDTVFDTMTKIPNSFWEAEEVNSTSDNTEAAIVEAVQALILDSVFVHFGIGEYKDEKDGEKHLEPLDDHADVSIRLFKVKTQNRWKFCDPCQNCGMDSPSPTHSTLDPDAYPFYLRLNILTIGSSGLTRDCSSLYMYLSASGWLCCVWLSCILTSNEYPWRPTDHVRVGLFVSASLALGLISIVTKTMSTELTIQLSLVHASHLRHSLFSLSPHASSMATTAKATPIPAVAIFVGIRT